MSELPKTWAEATLGELCQFENGDRGKNYSGRETFVSEGIPFISAGHLTKGSIDWSSMNYIPRKNFELLGSGKIRRGDFLFCLRGSLGKFASVQTDREGAIASSLVIVRNRKQIESSLLAYYFQSSLVKVSIAQHSNGSAQPNLSSNSLGQFIFPLPPLAEQKRIVAKLDTLSAKSGRARTELARIETLVSRYKQAVLGKAFNGELTREWRAGGAWPKRTKLCDVAKSFDYGSSAKSQKAGAVPVLRMGNIQQGILDWSDLVFTDDDSEIEKYRLSSGDVLFNRTNSPALVGKTALYRGERDAIFAGYLIRIRVGPNLRSEYLTYALNGPDGRAFSWEVKTDGVSQSNISATKLKEFALSVPSLEEQSEIVSRIESAFARIDRLAAEAKRALTLLGRLDEAILAKAFRGDLVPQDENDEPASVLLDRIQAERAAAPKQKRGRKA